MSKEGVFTQKVSLELLPDSKIVNQLFLQDLID